MGDYDGPNQYAYLHNNPLSFFDAFGLATDQETVDLLEDFSFGEQDKYGFCQKNRKCKKGGDLQITSSSQLPRIDYCDVYEYLYPFYERSREFDLGLPELQDIEIGFINGVWNDFESAQANAMHISKLAGGLNVHAVFNATHGQIPDLQRCLLGSDFCATEPVHLLHQMWNSFFDRSSSTARYLMVCHSEGAIHVRNALLDYPPELRNRIMVVAIAPGGYIYRETCASVVHYINESALRDFIPRFDSKGLTREKDTIVQLRSHPDAPWFDHGFTSPTYSQEIRQELYRYLSNVR